MEKLNCFENWWYNKDKLWCMSATLTPDPSGRAGLCFVYQKPNMADTEFQEFLNCQNHDGSIFIKIMLCIFFSVNKMHQVYFQKVHLQKLSEKKNISTYTMHKEGKIVHAWYKKETLISWLWCPNDSSRWDSLSSKKWSLADHISYLAAIYTSFGECFLPLYQ